MISYVVCGDGFVVKWLITDEKELHTPSDQKTKGLTATAANRLFAKNLGINGHLPTTLMTLILVFDMDTT